MPVVKTSGVQMAATTASRTSRQVVPMAAAVLRPAVISNGVPIAATPARRAVAVPTAARVMRQAVISNGVPIAATQARRAMAVPTAVTVMRPAVISNGVPVAATQPRRAVIVPTAAVVMRPPRISNTVPMGTRTEDTTEKRQPKTVKTMKMGSILRSGIVAVEVVLVMVKGGVRTRVS